MGKCPPTPSTTTSVGTSQWVCASTRIDSPRPATEILSNKEFWTYGTLPRMGGPIIRWATPIHDPTHVMTHEHMTPAMWWPWTHMTPPIAWPITHDPTHRMTHCGTHQNPIDRDIWKWPLLTFSLLVSEDFWVVLSLLSDRNIFVAPSDNCAENTAIARKERTTQKSSLISKEKVNKVGVVRGLWGSISPESQRYRPSFAYQYHYPLSQ